ncbi:MAG: hypothetical protein U0W40_15490 [Acidimicrobiia bacterium]
MPPKKTAWRVITADLPDNNAAGVPRPYRPRPAQGLAMVISPFSRGGRCELRRLLDHTLLPRPSRRAGTKVPNISDWRRKTVGDLTTTVDLKTSNTTAPLPLLDDQVARLNQECPANQSPASLLAPPPVLQIPFDQQMPTQEKR